LDHFFSLEILCRKDNYNVNHSLGIIIKNHFFSCWALSYNYIKINGAFNSLLLFSVCHLQMGVLAHVVGINFTLELFFAYLNIIKIVFSIVFSTHMVCYFHSFNYIWRLYLHNFLIIIMFLYFPNFVLFLIIKICD
jgi:hypothetical protein